MQYIIQESQQQIFPNYVVVLTMFQAVGQMLEIKLQTKQNLCPCGGGYEEIQGKKAKDNTG